MVIIAWWINQRLLLFFIVIQLIRVRLIGKFIVILIGGNKSTTPFALLFFPLTNVLLKRLVEFIDPTLYAAKVEWLAALFAIPKGRSLVNRVLADEAVLSALRKRLDQIGALFREILVLLDEVLIVVLTSWHVPGFVCLLHHLNFFMSLLAILIVIELRCLHSLPEILISVVSLTV